MEKLIFLIYESINFNCITFSTGWSLNNLCGNTAAPGKFPALVVKQICLLIFIFVPNHILRWIFLDQFPNFITHKSKLVDVNNGWQSLPATNNDHYHHIIRLHFLLICIKLADWLMWKNDRHQKITILAQNTITYNR